MTDFPATPHLQTDGHQRVWLHADNSTPSFNTPEAKPRSHPTPNGSHSSHRQLMLSREGMTWKNPKKNSYRWAPPLDEPPPPQKVGTNCTPLVPAPFLPDFTVLIAQIITSELIYIARKSSRKVSIRASSSQNIFLKFKVSTRLFSSPANITKV